MSREGRNFIKPNIVLLALLLALPIGAAFAVSANSTTGGETSARVDVSKFDAEETARYNQLTPEEQADLLNPETPEYPAGTVSCFDNYHFGSVQVSLQSHPTTVMGGEPVIFAGEVVNRNAYPVVDVSVYIKVFRTQGDANKQHLNGDFLVDQFMVTERLDIGAHATKKIQFVWDAPRALIPGAYRMATYVVAANKFNLAGSHSLMM